MSANPTDALVLDFPGFVAARRQASERHMVNGVPDYGFSLDRKLRGKLVSMPPLRSLARTLVQAQEPLMQQINLMNGIAVGPRQYPEIFAIGEHCARTLGIGVPRLFLLPSEASNAWTYASDDARPSIVLTTRVLRNLSTEELTGIIGHECGHIHNLHSAYNTLVELLANTTLRGLMLGSVSTSLLSLPLALLGGGLKLFMLEWSRAAEITADRAGSICAGGVRPMMSALMKLKTSAEPELAEVNIDEYLAQFDQLSRSPVKLTEFLQTHPVTQKRIAALRLFEDSQVLASWLGDSGDLAGRLSAEALDRQCEAIVRVV
jgi:Zn-dependent protease with chaperone function